MEYETVAFDARGFLDLLTDVVHYEDTGVLNVRIHVRDGMPWAVSVQFDKAGKRAA